MSLPTPTIEKIIFLSSAISFNVFFAIPQRLGGIAPEAVELFLVVTQFLGAVAASEVSVGVFREAFGVEEEGDLPSGQQHYREGQQAPGIGLADEEERREHHGVVPVVDAAGGAALVLQEPGLEGAEEEDADDVAHRIGRAEQQHDAVVEDTHHVEAAEDQVERYPYQRHEEDGVVVLNLDFRPACLLIVAGELFLASGALQLRGEEAHHHLDDEEQPYRRQRHRMTFDNLSDLLSATRVVEDIQHQQRDERRRTQHQPDVVHHAYGSQFPFLQFIHLLLFSHAETGCKDT